MLYKSDVYPTYPRVAQYRSKKRIYSVAKVRRSTLMCYWLDLTVTYGKYRKRLKINLPMQEECTSSFCHLFRIRVFSLSSFFGCCIYFLLVFWLSKCKFPSCVFAFFMVFRLCFMHPCQIMSLFQNQEKRLISTLGNQYNGTGFL